VGRNTPDQERPSSLAYSAMADLVIAAIAGFYALTVGYAQLW
jgi:hypothetical protein